MNVGDLRRAIEGLDDDAMVAIEMNTQYGRTRQEIAISATRRMQKRHGGDKTQPSHYPKLVVSSVGHIKTG